MAHNEQNIENYHEGDAHEIVVTVENQEGKPFNIVGGSAEWVLQENRGDEGHLVEKTGEEDVNEDEIAFLDPENGELKVIIETEDTTDIITWEDEDGDPVHEKELYHRLRVTDSEGRRVTGFHGTFEMHQ